MSDEAREQAFACVLDAISAEDRPRHEALWQKLQSQTQGIDELENGYSFRLPADLLPQIGEHITLERLCCPFLDFTVRVSANDDIVRYELTGREGVKAFLKANMTN